MANAATATGERNAGTDKTTAYGRFYFGNYLRILFTVENSPSIIQYMDAAHWARRRTGEYMDTHQDQKHEIDLLRRQLDESADAMREAIDALDLAERVQAQLVAALQIAKAELEKVECRGHGDTRTLRELNPYPFDRIDAALTAAGATQ